MHRVTSNASVKAATVAFSAGRLLCTQQKPLKIALEGDLPCS